MYNCNTERWFSSKSKIVLIILLEAVSLEKFLQSFVHADKSKCIGCRACEVACSASHSIKAGYTIGSVDAQIMPRLFFVKKGKDAMPVQCHHCEDAPCRRSCASGAIQVIGQKVIIDEAQCTGCKNCIAACPFGVIEILKKPNKPGFAGKCDLCQGRDAGPACIETCPQKALRYIEPQQEVKNKRNRAVEYLLAIGRQDAE